MEFTNKKMVIALDTNVLLGIESLKINPFEEIRLGLGSSARIVVPLEVKKELENIEGNKKMVKTAITILGGEKPEIVETKAKNADDALLELAKKGFVVATNDRLLRKKIRNANCRIIFFRKKGMEIA